MFAHSGISLLSSLWPLEESSFSPQKAIPIQRDCIVSRFLLGLTRPFSRPGFRRLFSLRVSLVVFFPFDSGSTFRSSVALKNNLSVPFPLSFPRSRFLRNFFEISFHLLSRSLAQKKHRTSYPEISSRVRSLFRPKIERFPPSYRTYVR